MNGDGRERVDTLVLHCHTTQLRDKAPPRADTALQSRPARSDSAAKTRAWSPSPKRVHCRQRSAAGERGRDVEPRHHPHGQLEAVKCDPPSCGSSKANQHNKANQQSKPAQLRGSAASSHRSQRTQGSRKEPLTWLFRIRLFHLGRNTSFHHFCTSGTTKLLEHIHTGTHTHFWFCKPL